MAYSNGLKVSYEETKAAGMRVVALKEQLLALLAEVRKLNDEITANYQDEAMVQYSQNVIEQANKMEKVLESIGETGNFVKNAGQAYEDVARQNRSYMA